MDSKTFVSIAKELKKRGMKYDIFLGDVQKAIDDENIGDQHLFSATGFDYAKYNTLSAVCISTSFQTFYSSTQASVYYISYFRVIVNKYDSFPSRSTMS